MSYDIQKCKDLVLETLNRRPIKYEIHDFDSGCSMVDIWEDNKFYVVHIEHDAVGLSLIEGIVDFSNIPDERFFDLSLFFEKLNKVLSN